MYIGYSRPNSPATIASASSIAFLFSAFAKSTNGSFTNSPTDNFTSAVAITHSSPSVANTQFYCLLKPPHKRPPTRAPPHTLGGGSTRICKSTALVRMARFVVVCEHAIRDRPCRLILVPYHAPRCHSGLRGKTERKRGCPIGGPAPE